METKKERKYNMVKLYRFKYNNSQMYVDGSGVIRNEETNYPICPQTIIDLLKSNCFIRAMPLFTQKEQALARAIKVLYPDAEKVRMDTVGGLYIVGKDGYCMHRISPKAFPTIEAAATVSLDQIIGSE